MSYKISKELFEAVMNIEPRGNTFRVESKGMYYAKNYYTYNDFFFKCKEWAFNNRYLIHTSWILSEKNYGKIVLEVKHFYRPELDRKARERFGYHHKEYFDTEQQACFDACQWILDNKDKQ